MSLAEQREWSEPPHTGEEQPAGAWTSGTALARVQLLNELVLDSPPPEAIAGAKLLFAKVIGSEDHPAP